MRENTSDFESLFLNDIPLMDVRAPVEFQKGAFPNALNKPILNDEQRVLIGTCYKKEGQDAAVRLGNQLATEDIRQQRLDYWLDYCKRHPQGYLYCFRGGMRSNLTQQWLREAGCDYPLVEGGYKAIRQFLIQHIDDVAKKPMLILGGLTGSAKGKVIENTSTGIDLEKAAHHRGSSFGSHPISQPTQINFEHAIALALLKLKNKLAAKRLVLEDEGRAIGSLSLPLSLYGMMKKSPVLELRLTWLDRLENLVQEYAVSTLCDFLSVNEEEQAWQAYEHYLLSGIDAIKKRLGLERYKNLRQLMRQAIMEHKKYKDPYKHLVWLEPLLKDYYDPMYRYQLKKKEDRIVFRGEYKAVVQYIEDFR